MIIIKRYSYSVLYILFSAIAFHNINASEVIIHGTDSSYAGYEIALFKYGDLISDAEVPVINTTVATDGTFSLCFDIEETTFVFAYLGIYKIHLYAEPGMKYQVLLPPRKDKTQAEMLNPYFSTVTVHLGTVNYDEEELNTLIRMFNDAYIPYYNKHIERIARKDDFSELDRDIQRMEKPFSKTKHSYFNHYRNYKYALLRYIAFQHRSRHISDDLFVGNPVLPGNIAYMELFNKVYDRYLNYFSRTDAGAGLGDAIRTQKFDPLRSLLASDEVLGKGNLPDLVLLKSLYDEFYDDNYSRSVLLKILDDYIETTNNKDMLAVARSIRSKVTRLLVGFEPPAFELYDKDSNLVTLSYLKGKYVYLNFCSCFSYTCLKEFKMLSTLYEKHKDILEIVTIIVDDDPNVITGFLERSEYKWKFLHYANQSAIIRDYDIRAFPTYYLLDKDSKLVMSPAPTPDNEFEARLFKLLRAKGEL